MQTTTETKRKRNKDDTAENKRLKQNQPETVEEWETLMESRIEEENDFVNVHREIVKEWYTRNEFNPNYDETEDEDQENPFTSRTYETLKKVYMDMGAMETEKELQAYFIKLLDVQKRTLTWIDEQEENREYSKHCVFPNNDEECECPECHGNHEGYENDEEFELCEDCMDGATGDCGWCTYHKYTCRKD